MNGDICIKHKLFLNLLSDLQGLIRFEKLSLLEKACVLYKEVYRRTHLISLHDVSNPYIYCKKTCCRKSSCPKVYKLQLSNDVLEIERDDERKNEVKISEIDARYNVIDPEITSRIRHEVQTCTALRKVSLESVPRVLHKDQWIPVRLVKVIDGDTISVALLTGNGEALKVSVRIMGIDCPEKSRASEKEIKCSLLITEYLKKQLPEILRVKFIKPDKWGGRWLGYVQYHCSKTSCECGCGFSGVCVGSRLLTKGFAKPYFGDKKSVWTEEELDKILSSF